MWLLDKMARVLDDLNSESDEIGEALIRQRYFGLLRVSGVYVRLDKGHRLLSFLHIFFIVIVLLIHWVLVVKPSFSLMSISFVIFGQNIHFCLLMQLVVIVIIFAQSRHQQIFLFHKAMAVNFFDYSEPYEGVTDKLEEEMRLERRLLLAIPVSVAIAASGVLLISPVVDQYGSFDSNKTSSLVNGNLPFPFAEYPFSTEEPLSFYVALFFQFVTGFILASSIASGGFMYILTSQSLLVQLKISLDSLENIEMRTKMLLTKLFGRKSNLPDIQMYNREEFVYCYKKCLKKSLQHHQVIIRYFNIWKSIFSLPVFGAYITGTIVIALSLLSLSSWVELPGTTIASMVLCGAEVGYMYLFSFYSQRITDVNEELRFKMYCIKWYYCDDGVRRSLRIFQEMAMRPMTLMAGGIIPANMDTFAKVMNSAYSYYNLANAFNVA